MPQEMLQIRRVVKRDGTVADFDRSRFDSAVERAARETGQEVSLEAVYEHALKEAQPLLGDGSEGQLGVEQILDTIEMGLMDAGYNDVAKAFIRYRHRRDRQRELGSGYSRAISDINMRFETQGNVAGWLDAIGRAAASQYIALAEMPPRVSRSVAENYLVFPNLIGYGRTVERLSLSVAGLLASGYLASRHMTPARRLGVAMNHIVDAYRDVAADISGEQSYYGLDRDLGEIVRSLAHQPAEDDYRQAAQSLVYSLGGTGTRNGGPGLTVSLGLDTTPEGSRFARALVEALSQAHAAGVDVRTPHLAFLVSEDVNWDPGSPNRDLLEAATALAEARGSVSFSWDDGYGYAYFSDGTRIAAGDCVSLTVDVNAAKLVAEAGGEFQEAFGLLAETVEAAAAAHDQGLGGKGEECFPALRTLGLSEDAGWGFSRALQDRTVLVGIVGLAEAARILDPTREGGLESTARLARVMAKRMRKRLLLSGGRYVLYPASSRVAARKMFDRDRDLMAEKYGISSYLPSPALMPVGYPVADRMALEGGIYPAFGTTGRLQVEGNKGRAEIEAGILAVRDSSAVLGITGRS